MKSEHIFESLKSNEVAIFDVEATSLHGTGFAFGLVVADLETGEIKKKIGAICELPEEPVQFVRDEVLPALADADDLIKVKDVKALRDLFWDIYEENKHAQWLGDVIWPVEARWLLDVVADDVEARQWNAPYPLLDVAAYVPVQVDRAALAQRRTGKVFRKHHPIDDALASFEALLEVTGG